MTFYANDVHPIPPDRYADDCDDQLPLIARVGRGVKGDSGRIFVNNGRIDTHLVGGHIDNANGELHTDWISDNINGGELRYQYNLNPFSIPRTFTITFIYTRGHEGDENYADWSWTSPAIPYIWRVTDEDGNEHEQPDHVVGSGVATLFVKTVHESWDISEHERLHYPIDPTTDEPFDRDYFNAPEPENPWSATITFGHGGDIDVPDFDDIAKIIGITKEDIYNILEDNSVTINGIEADDLIDYIDKCDDNVLSHIHTDLGFCNPEHGDTGAFGGQDTVKAYIDAKFSQLSQSIANLIYGATVNADGSISLPSGTKIATGNINVFSGSTSAYIRTRDGEVNNDLKGM